MADVSLRHVSKRFGRQTVIDDVSLAIGDREFVVLAGPSGCGKSTLLRLIAGLETPTRGEVWIGGKCVNDWTPRERSIAMVFQSYALYPHMSVYDNIAFGLTRMSMPRREIDRRVRRAADRLQIGDLLARKPKELSGGQRQRVAIGRAIVREPQVFLFDEPLSNLDAILRTEMRLEFMTLHRELGTTIVYVTHDQAEAMILATEIVVLRDGRVEQIGPPTEVYSRPRNRFVARFIGSPSMNMIECRLDAAEADGARLVLPDGLGLFVPVDAGRGSIGGKVTLGVRPEHIHASKAGDALTGTVVAIERLGSESLTHIKLSSGEIVTQRLIEGSETAAEGVVRLAIDPIRCHLFDSNGNAFPSVRAEPGSLADPII
jgi:multiple sugar transport system ATP-binding protein